MPSNRLSGKENQINILVGNVKLYFLLWDYMPFSFSTVRILRLLYCQQNLTNVSL